MIPSTCVLPSSYHPYLHDSRPQTPQLAQDLMLEAHTFYLKNYLKTF